MNVSKMIYMIIQEHMYFPDQNSRKKQFYTCEIKFRVNNTTFLNILVINQKSIACCKSM